MRSGAELEAVIENLMAIHKWAEDSMIKLNGVGIAESIDGALDALNSVVYCKDCRFSHMTYDGYNKYCDIISTADENGHYGDSEYLPGDWYCAAGEGREDG